MKKILTLLLVAGVFSTSFAQWRNNGDDNQNSNGTSNDNGQYGNRQNNNYQNSALVVNANSQNGFKVSVDNGNTYPSNSNTVRLRTLSPGNHIVTVTEFNRGILGRQVPRVIYNSTINFKSGIETTLTIDNNGQVNITERQLSGNSNGNGNNGKNGKVKKMKKTKYPHDTRNGDKEKKHGHDHNDNNDSKDD
ncbi:MAG: hypothetical protein LH615_09560 [Ferruginibacter sp.]|nr:hypothetical protein [Ferruginibacter sp.]